MEARGEHVCPWEPTQGCAAPPRPHTCARPACTHARTRPQSAPVHARRARTASASPSPPPALLRHFPALAPCRQPALPGPSLPLAGHSPRLRPLHGSAPPRRTPPPRGGTAPGWTHSPCGGRRSPPYGPRGTAAMSWGRAQPSVGPGVVGRLPRVRGRGDTQTQRGPGGIRVSSVEPIRDGREQNYRCISIGNIKIQCSCTEPGGRLPVPAPALSMSLVVHIKTAHTHTRTCGHTDVYLGRRNTGIHSSTAICTHYIFLCARVCTELLSCTISPDTLCLYTIDVCVELLTHK